MSKQITLNKYPKLLHDEKKHVKIPLKYYDSIYWLRSKRLSHAKIAERFNCSKSTIARILNPERWKSYDKKAGKIRDMKIQNNPSLRKQRNAYRSQWTKNRKNSSKAFHDYIKQTDRTAHYQRYYKQKGLE